MTDATPTVYDNHVTEARAAIGRRNNGGEVPAEIIAVAQVRATLAVAEQARIANLLAAQANNRAVIARHPEIADGDNARARATFLGQQIREALGGPQISDNQEGSNP
ncbi:hypothetical protein [Frigoribacterium sp. VKM Ac-2530]|uniref:hypothetical protein n=1 Tax=Frigoribacterium sp. VKM Ac-2530 TaxID=2783822 RepID=UPI001889D793|nr:hypothetical protein [Frigoribacterium sp. VKM Ac-2530]MBF4578940.1 hypothetical protein [Frigoribacterium sp. VKM Ac-2530]